MATGTSWPGLDDDYETLAPVDSSQRWQTSQEGREDTVGVYDRVEEDDNGLDWGSINWSKAGDLATQLIVGLFGPKPAAKTTTVIVEAADPPQWIAWAPWIAGGGLVVYLATRKKG
jgi:hypothetical protein